MNYISTPDYSVSYNDEDGTMTVESKAFDEKYGWEVTTAKTYDKAGVCIGEIVGPLPVEPPKVGTVEFEMEVEDVFSIMGRGTVVTGNITTGTIKVGDEVLIFNNGIRTQVTGIEMFRKQCDSATVGDNVGILLKDVSRDEIERGFLIIK